jgi:predicted nucleic acid-binding protein
VTLVVDASLVVVALAGAGASAEWAESMLLAGPICAPHVMPAEVADTLRRGVRAGRLSVDAASLAYADLLDMRVELYPFAPFAVRVWELRDNVGSYDAWYVALAELLGAPVATLDLSLAKAVGPRCRFELPPSA